jgi:hypothetical protein
MVNLSPIASFSARSPWRKLKVAGREKATDTVISFFFLAWGLLWKSR